MLNSKKIGSTPGDNEAKTSKMDTLPIIKKKSQEKMNQLPADIEHITQGYMSLETLIARLAQKTYLDLIGTIKDLAQMPIPASKLNINGSQISTVDDHSEENIAKKLRMIKFATDSHEAWTKALVITGWSRKAEDVSKIIDLKVHMDQKQQDYVAAIEQMAHDKKGFIHARLPNPDIMTALEVMTTGKVSWMPDFGYIPPPPLTARDMLKTLERINTLLSIRLNLEDYDKIPYHFKNFHIKSGRVTFRVEGEFELDLTIAEEAPEAQYWFLDLRFMFSPCLEQIGQGLRNYIESKLNALLLKDGLSGCYNVLHDIVLTHKISEFRRQALNLAKNRWVHSVKVEALNRSICIQYWADRFHKAPKINKTPRSWIILGVHSGMPKNGRPDAKTTRRLGIRWFRENKEQKDVEIKFDENVISAEALLTIVASKHIEYILKSIFENLRAKQLFAKQSLSLSLSISTSDPASSELKVQLTAEHHLSIRIEPLSGLFIFQPPTRRFLDYQRRLNSLVTDPAGRTHEFIELLRYAVMYDSLLAHGWTSGWKSIRNPGINNLEMKRVFTDAVQVHWFRKPDWAQDWYLAISMNMAGENWRLVQTALTSDPTNPNNIKVIPTQLKMPITAISPNTSFRFMTTLSIYSAAFISYYENIKILWAKRCLYTLTPANKTGILNLPFINLLMSELLDSQGISYMNDKAWAKDFVRLNFHGIELGSLRTLNFKQNNSQAIILGNQPQPNREDIVTLIAQIQILKPVPRPLFLFRENFNQNIAFHPETGYFALRLCTSVGGPIIKALADRLTSVQRLVEFTKILEKHEENLKCKMVSLSRLAFEYQKHPGQNNSNNLHTHQPVYKAGIEFSSENDQMTLLLDEGNPHLRIADHLTSVLNASEGLDGFAILLPLTTQILQGFEAIEETWSIAPMCEYGFVITHARAVDWYMIHYTMKEISNLHNNSPQQRRYLFEVNMRQRKGKAWWQIHRFKPHDPEKYQKDQQDDLDEALKPLWHSSGNNWLGMSTSAVGTCNGVVELLQKLDEVVRNFARR
ncbi:Mediator of RNA polymerase II transcription subunit 14 [Podosphaera aphanis]|nr:Mediator of RNA polymerase II transcription subunit 14 [Podosphaera aphanis]